MSGNLWRAVGKLCLGLIPALVITFCPLGRVYADNAGVDTGIACKDGIHNDNSDDTESTEDKSINPASADDVSKGSLENEVSSVGYDINVAGVVDGSQSVPAGVYRSASSAGIISGSIKLPEGMTAPSGGISGQLNIDLDDGTGSYQDIYQFTIPEGQTHTAFSFTVPQNDPGTGYIVKYSLNGNVQDIVNHGYYSTTGTLPHYSREAATRIDVGPGDEENIEVVLLSGRSITGTISMPVGMPAFSGDIYGNIYIDYKSDNHDFFGMESCMFTIFAGQTSASFYVVVPVNGPGTGYNISYNFFSDINGCIKIGYYSADGMVTKNELNKATLLDVSSGSISGMELTIISARVVSGSIALPSGASVPSGGIEGQVFIKGETYSDYKSFSMSTGNTVISYSINVPSNEPGKGYTLYYSLKNNIDTYIQYGYYAASGSVPYGESASVIDLSSGDCYNIDLTILKGNSISGTISLPEGMTARDNDIFVSVQIFKDNVFMYTPSYIIKKGKSEVAYCVNVPINEPGRGYTVRYDLNTVVDGLFTYGLYTLNGTLPDFGHEPGTLIDVSSGNITDIDFTLLKTRGITGKISLPVGMTAPSGGINGIIRIWYDDNDENGYIYKDTNFAISSGAAEASYSVEIPEKCPGIGYYASYGLLTNVPGCYISGYYSPNGTLTIPDPSLVYLGSGDQSNINFYIKYVPDNIEINGPANLYIPSNGYNTFTYTAVVKNQSGTPIPSETVNWSLDKSVAGVQINSSSGILTVQSTAQPDTLNIIATNGLISKSFTIAVLAVQNSTINPATANFDLKTSAQADISVSTTLNGNTVLSIKNGINTLAIGTDYTSSGNSIIIKKGYLAGLPVGTTVLTFYFSAGSNAELTITVTDSTTSNDGGGGGGGGGLGGGGGGSRDGKPVNGVKNISPTYSPGSVSVDIPTDDYKEILNSATAENGLKNITINISDADVNGYVTYLPSWALTSTSNETNVTLNTVVASITLPSNMFNDAAVKTAQKVGISISTVDKSKLPASVAEQIGDSPVIDLSVTVNGTVKEWNNPAAPVTVSIPYTLKAGERGDNITVFYIDGKGNLVNMQGVYNPETKTVTFSATHCSQYVAKDNKITFIDLAGFEKYAVYIESMAAKGIINGVGNNRYAPGNVLTRAEFSKLLVTMLKLEINNKDNVFSDVQEADWYAPYVNAAYKAGLIKGIGADKFAPDETITTQDAALILVRALAYKGIQITAGSISNIKDYTDISSYAEEAVGFTVSKGITPLDPEGNLNAKGNVNRASAAQYIYNVFNFE